MDCPRLQNRCLYLKFCMKNVIQLRSKLVILKAFEENFVEEIGAGTGIIFQTLVYCKPSDRGIE